MRTAEAVGHVHKKLRQVADFRYRSSVAAVRLEPSGPFPQLPPSQDAPMELRQALRMDLDAILVGKWKLFDALELGVNDPPLWHYDYAAQAELATMGSAFGLGYRHLPQGADIKLIWELSRWSQLVRLAMAAYVLGSEIAQKKCIEWLQDWVKHNPPYRGWNWTSALEVGIRLIQFSWIDELLCGVQSSSPTAAPTHALEAQFDNLRQILLPAHVRYAWRYRSFGSSANNHLLGELAGCIVATVRWPKLAEAGTSLDRLQACWEHEVLQQFAIDGGNREQALNYHLFSFELCWQALKAIEAAGHEIAPRVRERLGLAAAFYKDVQVPNDPWDYGDSDGAHVTPFFVQSPIQDWHEWISTMGAQTGVGYWLGHPPNIPAARKRHIREKDAWRFFPYSGIAVSSAGMWRLRWDLSPLGYLTTGAHGHLDALHLSIWFRDVALVIDPGTGAYYTNQDLRRWLASGGAHNGPRPPGAEHPPRLGTFLWGGPHPTPSLTIDESGAHGVVDLSEFRLHRRISRLGSNSGWQVEDGCLDARGRAQPFTVLWQFAPETQVQRLAERVFLVQRRGVAVRVMASFDWEPVELIVPEADGSMHSTNETGIDPLRGVVSPGFRQVCRGPLLMLSAQPTLNLPGTFSTAFCEAE